MLDLKTKIMFEKQKKLVIIAIIILMIGSVGIIGAIYVKAWFGLVLALILSAMVESLVGLLSQNKDDQKKENESAE